MNHPAKSRLESLDIVRGLAALIVVLFHYSSKFPDFYPAAAPMPFTLPLGFYGVHLFFMVSGFVILMSLMHRNGDGFIRSRFIRLFPLFWAGVLLSSLILTFDNIIPDDVNWQTVAVNMTMLEDYVKIPAIDGVYWSLSFELGFYAFMFAIFRLRLARWVEWVPYYMIAGSVLFYLVPAWVPHPLHYLLMINAYAHFFGAGMAFFLMYRHGPTIIRVIPILIVPLIQYLYDGAIGLMVCTALIAVMGFAIGWKGEFSDNNAGHILARAMIRLGGWSYALYLTHQMIGYVLMARLQLWGCPALLSAVLTLALAIALAGVLTHFVERPAARWLKQHLPETTGGKVSPVKV